jgi:hypothetical protein
VLGYPDDLRTHDQRRRAAESILGDVEASAARVVARLLGEAVVLQDDNSEPHTPDIRIHYADGRTGYVEVVSDIDPRYAEAWEQIVRRGFNLPADGLSKRWFITLSPDGRFSRIDRELPRLLSSVEEASVEHPSFSQCDLEVLRSLGVVDAVWFESSRAAPPLLRISLIGATGPADVPPDWFSEALDQTIASGRIADVWPKLANAVDADEWHVFLVPTASSRWPLYHMLRPDSCHLPIAQPTLPEPVTGLWLMNCPLAVRCLRWSPTAGWLDTREHWRTP